MTRASADARRDEPTCANRSRLSRHWPRSVEGLADVLALAGCARISSTCAAVRRSIICTCWLVPSRLKLRFKRRLDVLTAALVSTTITHPRLPMFFRPFHLHTADHAPAMLHIPIACSAWYHVHWDLRIACCNGS